MGAVISAPAGVFREDEKTAVCLSRAPERTVRTHTQARPLGFANPENMPRLVPRNRAHWRGFNLTGDDERKKWRRGPATRTTSAKAYDSGTVA